MSRDYKSRKPSKSTNESGGSTFWGGFVGYALGLVSAIGIWLYLNYSPSPFLSNEKVTSSSEKSETHQTPDQTKTPEKPTHGEPLSLVEEKPRFDFYKILPGIEEPEMDQPLKQAVQQPAPPQNITKNLENSNKSTEIVQQSISPQPSVRPIEATPQQSAAIHPRNHTTETVQQPVTPQTKNAKVTEKLYLQAGSFRKNDDAENLKARLALLGVIASIQSIDLAEKGIWYRVRVGPFTKKEDIDETSASLKENGINTQFIKTH